MATNKELIESEEINLNLEDSSCDLLFEGKGLNNVFDNLWSSQLTVIDLSKNQLKAVPERIGELIGIKNLNLSHNYLVDLPASVGSLTNLQQMDVSHNKLECLPDSISLLKQLTDLNISHNSLVGVPTFLEEGCCYLTTLIMSHNKFKEWKITPRCVYTLQVLNLSNNGMTESPPWLWGDLCHSLRALNLSNNCFITELIPPTQRNIVYKSGTTVSLQTLNVANCGIKSKDQKMILNQIKNLKSLNIGNVSSPIREDGFLNTVLDISFLPFTCKSTLTELVLSGLSLSMLPEDIDCLQNLEVIDCSKNCLQWLPENFCDLPSLRVAVLAGNGLVILPDRIDQLAKIEELWLANNQICSIPESFTRLTELRWLDLYDNDFEEWPSIIDPIFQNLKGLDVGFNCFEVEPQFSSDQSDVYMELKNTIRRHAMVKSETRTDDVKYVPEKVSSSCSYSTSSSLFEDEELEVNENADDRNKEEENWDLDDDYDDNFYPSDDDDKLVSRTVRSPHLFLIEKSIQNPDCFCPADIHAPLTIRLPKTISIDSDQGQFDDA